MKKTPLHDEHIKLGAKMIEFAGWMMPLQYESIVAEVEAVRKNVAVFDVSHMGEIRVSGSDTAAFLDWLLTNKFSTLGVGQAMYSVMCNEKGGIIDDLIAYRITDNEALLVVNAANTQKDFDWINLQSKKFNVQVNDLSDRYGLIAVQGPRSETMLSSIIPQISSLKYYHCAEFTIFGKKCTVSRTGYTGEDGFEICCPWEDTPHVWRGLFEIGENSGLKPAGLGARDVCRLEASYLLYGNDMDESVTPLEAGLGWVVKLEKDFVGKDALLSQKERGISRRIRGLKLEGKRIARHGMAVLKDDKQVGTITSGTFSPTLQSSIALAMLDASLKIGENVLVDLKGATVEAQIVKLPFYRGSVKTTSA
ncbi:MAG: glycine cleavage system aminomethyltransferase GcvT [Pseudothermotoga sp.]|uniref:glycine cleavage system aminomethyltransferase GcvT n=1 Tax=Pseudothermotoga sp. TaxID=2033661 RepID=UPI000E8A6637|nr:glycine cleavage system aminomethyltransferase GcvT [Pseudothermotoga sp.]HBT39957.1 glycine cleavage system aminomethyltransferase GcvT [Pseudothermotoga sp.]HCO98500.1 glycine cleavage system aminomethyltransferase GcvT [Pseudothermotoga sp.]